MAGSTHGDGRPTALVQRSIRASLTYAQATAALDAGARSPQVRTAHTAHTPSRLLLQPKLHALMTTGARARAREDGTAHTHTQHERAHRAPAPARTTRQPHSDCTQGAAHQLLQQQQQAQPAAEAPRARAHERSAAHARPLGESALSTAAPRPSPQEKRRGPNTKTQPQHTLSHTNT